MINVIIHLRQEHDPITFIEKLFEEKLIGMATIDKKNVSFVRKDDKIVKLVHSVITMQTKALLFSEITKIIEKEFGTDVTINSLPIVGSNASFDDLVRKNTKKV